jgi:glutamate formiminotransferase/formiminotetrahydrofolate cyclodeaminase
VDAAQWYLQLNDLEPNQILENRLAGDEAHLAPTAFLDATAAGTPAPGGGSVSALAGALAAALAEMVARLTVGKPKYVGVEAKMREAIAQAESLRTRLTVAVDADSAAFNAVVATVKMPKDTDEEKAAREAALQAATLHAAQVPLDTARASLQALELALIVAEAGNVSLMTDAAVAGLMAHAAVEGAGLNVRVNAASLSDQAQARALLEELNTLRSRATKLAEQVVAAAEQRGKIP